MARAPVWPLRWAWSLSFLAVTVLALGSATAAAAAPTTGPAGAAARVSPHGTPTQKSLCLACHAPHGSAYPRLLGAESPLSCYPCHPKPTTAGSRWTGEKTFTRSAHAELCLKCHNPHGVPDPTTRVTVPKALLAPESALCRGCHRGIDQRFEASLRVTEGSGVRSRHPVDVPGAKVGCVSCHNPHQIRQNPPGGFAPTLTDPDSGKLFTFLGGVTSQEFCFKCHDGTWPGAANIAAEVADRKAANSAEVFQLPRSPRHDGLSGDQPGAAA